MSEAGGSREQRPAPSGAGGRERDGAPDRRAETEPPASGQRKAGSAVGPGTAGGEGDALALRALSRERGHAFEEGRMRTGLRRAATDESGAAAWDVRRSRAGEQEDDGTDRGPGLPPGRDRPGPTRFDPRTGATDLARYAERHGWTSKLAMAGVSVRWAEIVGAQVAEHARIETFEPGLLVIRASSSAWAQQLRLMLPTLERQVQEALGPGGGAVEIRILGPAGPTWRHGRFGAARGGRGPRDTYG